MSVCCWRVRSVWRGSTVHHCVRFRLVWTTTVRHLRLSVVGQSARLDDGFVLHSLHASARAGRHSADVWHPQRGQWVRRPVPFHGTLKMIVGPERKCKTSSSLYSISGSATSFTNFASNIILFFMSCNYVYVYFTSCNLVSQFPILHFHPPPGF